MSAADVIAATGLQRLGWMDVSLVLFMGVVAWSMLFGPYVRWVMARENFYWRFYVTRAEWRALYPKYPSLRPVRYIAMALILGWLSSCAVAVTTSSHGQAQPPVARASAPSVVTLPRVP